MKHNPHLTTTRNRAVVFCCPAGGEIKSLRHAERTAGVGYRAKNPRFKQGIKDF